MRSWDINMKGAQGWKESVFQNFFVLMGNNQIKHLLYCWHHLLSRCVPFIIATRRKRKIKDKIGFWMTQMIMVTLALGRLRHIAWHDTCSLWWWTKWWRWAFLGTSTMIDIKPSFSWNSTCSHIIQFGIDLLARRELKAMVDWTINYTKSFFRNKNKQKWSHFTSCVIFREETTIKTSYCSKSVGRHTDRSTRKFECNISFT